MNTVQIRPEQARALLSLDAQVKEATRTFGAALSAVLAGQVDPRAQVQTISDDGTVTYTVEGE